MSRRAPRVVVAPDKFKGSLSAAQVAERVAAGLRRARPNAEVTAVPMADGGEGTLDAAVQAGFDRVPVTVTGPTGRPVACALAVRGDTAVVESAAASGLAAMPAGVRDPLGATSRGTGELVRAALDAGCRTVVIGVGGSACTDGGAGLLAAFGVRFFDGTGNELPDGGGALAGLAGVDLSGLDPRLADVELVLAGDVDNPLLGPAGAAAVYAPQKGASPLDVVTLEAGLHRLVAALSTVWGEPARAAAEFAGAGSAGGIGYGVMVLGGNRRPGVEVVIELVGLREALAGADLVVTGEGSLDAQTLHGKTVAGVAALAGEVGVPVVAVAGRATLGASDLASVGIAAARSLTELEPDVERCITEAGPLLEELCARSAAGWLTREPEAES